MCNDAFIFVMCCKGAIKKTVKLIIIGHKSEFLLSVYSAGKTHTISNFIIWARWPETALGLCLYKAKNQAQSKTF